MIEEIVYKTDVIPTTAQIISSMLNSKLFKLKNRFSYFIGPYAPIRGCQRRFQANQPEPKSLLARLLTSLITLLSADGVSPPQGVFHVKKEGDGVFTERSHH